MYSGYCFAMAALVGSSVCLAQNKPDFGEISPPVIDMPNKPDLRRTPVESPRNRSQSDETSLAETEERGPELKLPGVNLVPPPSKLNLDTKLSNFNQRSSYRSLEIAEPLDGTAIAIHSSNLQIRATLVPPVRIDLGHVLQILIDGNVLVENQTSYAVDDLARGKHSIKLRIVDEQGNLVAESKSVTVTIR